MTLLEEVRQAFGSSNLYDVLGVENTATGEEIKKAYHLLSLKVHPDRPGNYSEKEGYTTKFQLLTQIYLILSDNERRVAYDEHNYNRPININDGINGSNHYGFKRNGFKVEDSLIYDELPLTLLDYNRSTNSYTYECRCSGSFNLEDEAIRKLSTPPLTKSDDLNNELFVIVDCESCSLKLKIII